MTMWRPFRTKASCPVNPQEKLWIEGRFAWLREQFGTERLRTSPVVLPTPEYFPDPYGGEPDHVPPLFARVCGYLGLDAARFELRLYTEDNRVKVVDELGLTYVTLGLYQGDERPVVWLESSRLVDPPSLVATMIHEACHDLLLGAGRLRVDELDHELVTDLLTVYMGLGIITANAMIRESHLRVGGWYRWQISHQGYLTQRMYGYALALFAAARGETKPAWVKHLRLNVRVPCEQAIRYLAETERSEDSTGRPA